MLSTHMILFCSFKLFVIFFYPNKSWTQWNAQASNCLIFTPKRHL